MSTDTPRVALVCSVALEAEPVRGALRDARPLEVGRRGAWAGQIGETEVVLLPGGMGKTNAAQALTALLETHVVRGVVGFGVGGAYPGSALDTGSLVLATGESYGDEGVAAPDGWLSTEGIGFPLAERDGERWFNRFPVDPRLVGRAAEMLAAAGMPAGVGEFVTVSCCSGTSVRGVELAARFRALCESMEGAAYVHVATLYGVPVLEVRGISNPVEDRDLSRWRLRDAAEAAGAAAVELARCWDLLEARD